MGEDQGGEGKEDEVTFGWFDSPLIAYHGAPLQAVSRDIRNT